MAIVLWCHDSCTVVDDILIGMIQKSELKKTLKMEIEEYLVFVLKGQGRIGKPRWPKINAIVFALY